MFVILCSCTKPFGNGDLQETLATKLDGNIVTFLYHCYTFIINQARKLVMYHNSQIIKNSHSGRPR